MHFLLVILGLIIFAMLSSTPEGRAEARERQKPFARFCLVITTAIWAAILLPALF
jgi:hypothetical protein